MNLDEFEEKCFGLNLKSRVLTPILVALGNKLYPITGIGVERGEEGEALYLHADRATNDLPPPTDTIESQARIVYQMWIASNGLPGDQFVIEMKKLGMLLNTQTKPQ